MAGDEPLEDLIVRSETPRETLRRLREQAWDEGYSAAVVGEPKLNNPYQKEIANG